MGKSKTTKSPEELSGDFQTPPNVAAYMVSLMPDNINYILEPTCGKRNILKAIGKSKRFADSIIFYPDDYFIGREDLFKIPFGCVIMNPPFSEGTCIMTNAPEEWKKLKGLQLGYQFLLDAMMLSDSVICLLPWFVFADSDVRLRQIMSFGLKSITALPRKTFEYARIQTVVLELEKGYKGQTIFKSLDMIEGTKHNHPKLEL